MSAEAPLPEALQADLDQARDIQEGLLRQDTPAGAIIEVNRTLVAAETSGKFVAVVCVILDLTRP